MAYLPRQISVQVPNLTQEQLVDHLVRFDRNALKLCGIQRQHAVFKSQTSYPVTNRTKARYYVTAYIPLTDPMFQSEDLIEYVYPSRAAPYVQFRFDGYTDNSGIGKFSIE